MLPANMERVAIGHYGIPSKGVDVNDRYGKEGWPKGALGLCTEINPDGYFVVDGHCWLSFEVVICKDDVNFDDTLTIEVLPVSERPKPVTLVRIS